MQVSKLNFSGHNIYAGIDVHKKSWSVHIISDVVDHGSFTQSPDPQKLTRYLKKHFPGATYYSVYEAGFCGFWIHDVLADEGINCIVVNSSDIPTTNKEKTQKRDKLDCRKLARALRSNQLKPIFVPSRDLLEKRMLVRSRYKLMRNLTRCKNRIKASLNFYGITIPEDLNTGKWSIKFKEWLKNAPMQYNCGKAALNLYLQELEELEKLIRENTKQIKLLANTEKYKRNVELLCTIPGIGIIVAMTILTELGDINRFSSLDKLNSYIGMIPNVYASGVTEKVGHLTHRGNDILKCQLIESAWIAIRRDPALMLQYQELVKRMKPSKAIIRIVRKMINRIRYVLIHQQPYEIGIVS